MREARERGFPSGRVRSFACAGRGVWVLVRTQRNAWIHATATAGVMAAGLVLRVSREEWCLLILAMGLVWAAEGINTAVEALADAVSTAPDARIGRVKDIAAGGVLLAAVAAAAVGLLIFGPKLAANLGL